jgi:hypothetical protein
MDNFPEETPQKDLPASEADNDREPLQLPSVETGISKKKVWLSAAIIFSITGLWLMIMATFTDRPRQWLPYTEDLAQTLVPEASDGQEPVELLELTHSIDQSQISIQGKIRNRTAQSLNDVMAILKFGYTHLVEPAINTVKVDPAKMEPGAEGYFKLVHPLQGRLTGYSLTFKLENGAILRHRDSRSFSLPTTNPSSPPQERKTNPPAR